MFFQIIAIIVVMSILLILLCIDLKTQQLPDWLTIPAIAFQLVAILIFGYSLTDAAIGAALAGGFFAAQYLFSKGKWIGGGDIRLGVLMGLFLGFGNTVVALLVAYIGGAAIVLLLLATKRVKKTDHIPFGAFLIPATFIAFIAGEFIQEWYLGLLGII